MTRFWTSDTHFGHQAILKWRANTLPTYVHTVEQMNDYMVDRWNDVVSDGDTVHILGDMFMGQLYDSLRVLDRLKGTKILTPGNHDRMHPAYHHKNPERREQFSQRYLDAGLAEIKPISWSAGFVWDGLNAKYDYMIDVCHFPYGDEDHTDDPRYTQYRPSDYGANRVLHGHIHSLRRLSEDGRQLNVGVDVNDYTPLSDDDIITAFNL